MSNRQLTDGSPVPEDASHNVRAWCKQFPTEAWKS
jgi:hypothetical protein